MPTSVDQVTGVTEQRPKSNIQLPMMERFIPDELQPDII
jgi:hypothetical protein